MKAGETKSAIDVYADALKCENAIEAAARLTKISSIFKGFASRPLEELLKLLDRITAQDAHDNDAPNGGRVASVVASLQNLELILRKTSTRGRLEDLIAFRTRLKRHESASIEQLVEAVEVLRRGKGDEGPVDQNDELAKQLKAALGYDEQFKPLFERLSKLDATGVAAVANLLMSSGTSKSRKRDLDRIRERHESQRSLLAKRRAMAGRSAA